MKKIFFFIFMVSILLVEMPVLCSAASLNLTAPDWLPINTSCSYYSPQVKVDYSGLDTQKYTLKIWLLESPNLDPSPDCGSGTGCEAGFCPRAITIDNTAGGLSDGSVSIVEDFDVYNYTEFDWVIRLYNEAGSQVAWTEQYTPGTSNRAPMLNSVGDKTGNVGQLVEFYISGSDSDGNNLSYSAYNLPSGASFESATGKLNWTPSATGTYSDIMFRVTDDGEGNLYDDEIISISVNECSLPSPPSSPDPAVGAANISINHTLDWADIGEADSYNVYLGKASPPELVGNTTVSNFIPDALDYDTTYYWKIETVNACGTTQGSEWNFHTKCGPPSTPEESPSPVHRTRGVSINNLTLDWADSDRASSYNVYFGTSFPLPLVDTTATSNYTLSTLSYATQYYWQIVAVNDCGSTTGPILEFTTIKENASHQDKGFEFLYEVMDKYNDFIVYTEKFNISNHFSPSGWMGYISNLSFDDAYNKGPHSGAECIKISFNPSSVLSWAGIYWLYPDNNWGDISNSPYALIFTH